MPIVNYTTNTAPRTRNRRRPVTLNVTPRQREVLQFIVTHTLKHSLPPTRAEIAENFKFRSTNAAQIHVQNLADKNLITMGVGRSRAIKLTRDGREFLGLEGFCACCGRELGS